MSWTSIRRSLFLTTGVRSLTLSRRNRHGRVRQRGAFDACQSVRSRRPHGTRSLFGLAVASVAAVGLLAAAPVVAAAPTPAATATAFQVALTGSVGTPAAVFASATATLAAVTAPPDQTARVASIAARLGATTAFAADGTAQSSATSSASQNRGTSEVNALTAALLEQPITATTLSGTATCPAGGPPTAATVVAGLSVFGTAITAQLNATTTATAAVTVPGITGATLHASVRTGIEQVTATTATALSITFTLTGTVAGAPSILTWAPSPPAALHAFCRRQVR